MKNNRKAILVLSTFLFITIIGGLTSFSSAFIISETDPVYHEDLKGYWNFDNKTFEALDLSGEENHGTLDGGSYTESQDDYGNALKLDGSNDFVRVGDDNSLNDFDKFTITAWVKTNDIASYQSIISKSGDDPAHTKGFVLDLESNSELTLWIYTSGWEKVAYDISTEIEVGDWYHIAGVYDGDELKLYIDGDKVATEEEVGTLKNSNEDLLIGADYGFNPEGFWNGSLDEVAIFDSALSSDEIEEIYDEGIQPINAGETEIDWIELLMVMIPAIIIVIVIGLVIWKVDFKMKRKSKKKIPGSKRK